MKQFNMLIYDWHIKLHTENPLKTNSHSTIMKTLHVSAVFCFVSPVFQSPSPSPSSETRWPGGWLGSRGYCAPSGSFHSLWGRDL